MTHHKKYKTKMKRVYKLDVMVACILDDYFADLADKYLIYQEKRYIVKIKQLTDTHS